MNSIFTKHTGYAIKSGMTQGTAFLLALLFLMPLKAQAADSLTSMSGREARIKKSSSMIRFGASGSVFLTYDNRELDEYADKKLSVFIDVDPFSIKNIHCNGFDFYARYTLDSLGSDKGLSGNPDYYFFDPEISIHRLDAGARFIYGLYAFNMLWQWYISAAPCFAIYHENSFDDDGSEVASQTLYSLGVTGSAGFEVAFCQHIGLFIEYNNGYIPAGKSKSNITGHRMYTGLALRF